MQIHIGRAGEPLGTFTETEAIDGLSSGRFLPNDLAWREGMSEWRPLGEVVSAPVPPAAASPAPPVWNPAVQYSGPMAQGSVGIPVLPTPGTAIASLILGLLSLITCYFGFLFSIPGVICGHLALSAIKRSGAQYEGRGLALAGLIMNYLWLGIAVLLLLIFILVGAVASLQKPG